MRNKMDYSLLHFKSKCFLFATKEKTKLSKIFLSIFREIKKCSTFKMPPCWPLPAFSCGGAREGAVLGGEGGPSPGHLGGQAHGEGRVPSLLRSLISKAISWADTKAKRGCTCGNAL